MTRAGDIDEAFFVRIGQHFLKRFENEARTFVDGMKPLVSTPMHVEPSLIFTDVGEALHGPREIERRARQVRKFFPEATALISVDAVRFSGILNPGRNFSFS
jgi:hypothetical protein